MDNWDKYVVDSWVETILEAAYKQVVDSLPELLKDDPTYLNRILGIIHRNQEMAEEVATKERY